MGKSGHLFILIFFFAIFSSSIKEKNCIITFSNIIFQPEISEKSEKSLWSPLHFFKEIWGLVANTNKVDNGQPFIVPLGSLNASDNVPFIWTCTAGDLQIVFMIVNISSGVNWNLKQMKQARSRQSNAVSVRSNCGFLAYRVKHTSHVIKFYFQIVHMSNIRYHIRKHQFNLCFFCSSPLVFHMKQRFFCYKFKCRHMWVFYNLHVERTHYI